MEQVNIVSSQYSDAAINTRRKWYLGRNEGAEFLTFFFIFLFAYSALRKLVDLQMFVKELWGFSLFGSKTVIKWELIAISSFELLVAIMLAIPGTRRVGLVMCFVQMCLINILTLYMQQFAKIIPPLFGGIFPAVSFLGHLLINIMLLFVSLIALFTSGNSQNKYGQKSLLGNL